MVYLLLQKCFKLQTEVQGCISRYDETVGALQVRMFSNTSICHHSGEEVNQEDLFHEINCLNVSKE